jgi:hypothetical protein
MKLRPLWVNTERGHLVKECSPNLWCRFPERVEKAFARLWRWREYECHRRLAARRAVSNAAADCGEGDLLNAFIAASTPWSTP